MSLTQLSPDKSSWVRAIGYRNGYLAIFADNFAWLVSNVPHTLPGLLAAGHVNSKEGKLSIGAAVHRLVLRRADEFSREKVEGAALSELKKVMKTGEIS